MIQFRLHHRDGTFIDLYNKTPGQLSTVTEATQNTSIGGEDVITIVVKSSVVLDLRIGDSIVINSKTYKLNRLPEPKKTGDRMLVYNISMEGSKYDLLRVIFDLTIDTTSGALQDVSSNYLTGNIGLFGKVLIANANRVFAGKWTLGEYPDTEIKTLSFIETDNCLLAVNKIAEEFDTGIQIEESGGFFTLHFRETGDPIPATFRYGLEKGVYELSRQNVSTSNIVTRLKVYGSTRNITHSYRSSRLCLPNKLKSQSFIQEQGPVDAFGICEGAKLFDDIYPTREGTVSQVEFLTERELEDPPVEPEEGEEITAVNTSFVDSQMDFDLNEKREDGSTVYLLPGLRAKVHFQTGNLAGYEFEVLSYNHSEKKFVLKSFFDERGLAIPSETEPAFQYKDRDTYKLLDIALPQSYVDEAEQKLLQKGQEVYPKVSQPLVQYSLKFGPEYLKILYQGAPSTLKPGDLIYVVDEDIEVDKYIKIQSFTRDLLKPYSYSNVIISDTEAESVIARLLGEVNKLNNATESLSRNTSLDMYRNNELLKGWFLSKVRPDTAQGFIQFLKGISVEELATLTQGLEVGEYTSGFLGGGGAFKMKDGLSELEVDKLTVRMIATFFEIVVSKLRHINGGLVLSRGAMTCSRVVEDADSYQCFFERGENNEISNTFVVNDQARCQVFNGGNQKFYWRLVTAVGDDWIKLSKTVGIGDSIPEAGDDIVQLGYQGKDLAHVKRLNAQIIDESGISQYVEIDSFTLEGKRRNFISADGTGSQFTGKVSFKNAGQDYDLSDWATLVDDNLDETNSTINEVEERVNNTRVGVANLLRNTGFLGDFQPLNVDYLTALENSSPIDTNPLEYWIHSDTSVIDAPSRSGKGIRIGSIQQNVKFKAGEPYVLSFWAKGTSLIIGLVDTIETPLTSEYKRYSFDIIASETKEYTFSLIDSGNTAEVYEIMLSNGNTKASYSYAEEDDVKAISQIQAINTIINAIKTGKTEILGGLILSTMIQLGKYKDDVMEKVTSGINGIYNNDDDPAIWAGGSFADAIRTVQRLIDNPNNEPTQAEWAEMANIVMTHGGDGFFRGYIYALGGMFRGKVATGSGGSEIVLDPESSSVKYMRNGILVGETFFTASGWVRTQYFEFWDSGKLKGIVSMDSLNGFTMQTFLEDGLTTKAFTKHYMDGQVSNSNLLNLTDEQADEILASGQWYRTNRIVKIKP